MDSLLAILLVAILKLVMVGLDIAAFFVTIRLITLHWPVAPLLAFDRLGQPLVDPLVNMMQRMIPADWLGRDPRRTRLSTAAALLAVAICRLAPVSVVNLVIAAG